MERSGDAAHAGVIDQNFENSEFLLNELSKSLYRCETGKIAGEDVGFDATLRYLIGHGFEGASPASRKNDGSAQPGQPGCDGGSYAATGAGNHSAFAI